MIYQSDLNKIERSVATKKSCELLDEAKENLVKLADIHEALEELVMAWKAQEEGAEPATLFEQGMWGRAIEALNKLD